MREFFSMGGFGFYVWWSFGAVAALMIGEWLVTGTQGKAAIKKLKRMSRLQETQDKVNKG